ncbi:MAG TPA: ankyrin repeat domain-containing protein [Candidatus Deferrimicrobiaceae bacterium]
MRRRKVAACAALVAALLVSSSAHGRPMMPVPYEPPLTKAIREGDGEALQRFISNPSMLRIQATECSDHASPAAVAAAYGRIDVLKALVENGASVEGAECGGNTPLYEAADQGRIAIVRYLLSKGAAPSPPGNERHPVLLVAITGSLGFRGKPEEARDTIELARALLEAGADPSKADVWGVTPLFRAVRQADARLVRLLLAFGADPAAKNPQGKSALDLAKESRLDYIAALFRGDKPSRAPLPDPPLVVAVKASDMPGIKRIVDSATGLDARDDGGSSALLHAAARGNEAAAALLIKGGADPDIRNQGNATSLIYAASGGFPGIVEGLLSKGADVRARDFRGNTALHYAVQQDRPPVIALLAAAKADTEDPDDQGVTLLMVAADSGFTEAAKTLLDGGAKAGATDKEGRTALMHAAKAGNKGVADLLLAAGADADAKDKDGDTALKLAIDSGHADIADTLMGKSGAVPDRGALWGALSNQDVRLVETLLKKGVDPNSPRGETPLLTIAAGAYKEKLSLTRLMVEAGAHVNDAASDGKTALMEAACGSGDDSTDTLKYLLAHGADPKARDGKGRTAWRYAMESGHNRSAKALEAAGAPAEYESLAWDGIFFHGSDRNPASRPIESREAWAALWKGMGQEGEAPEIDFGRFAAAFVSLGPIEDAETEGIRFGAPVREGDTLIIPWSTHAYVIYDLFSTVPYAVKIVDRKGAGTIAVKSARNGHDRPEGATK